jgi:hypothetical protein
MVVHTGSVFSAGVQRLFADEANIEVVECDPRDNADLIQALQGVEPDIVILTGEGMDLPDTSRLLMALGSHTEIRVLIVSEDDNLVQIYDKRQFLVTTSSDLIKLVLDS